MTKAATKAFILGSTIYGSNPPMLSGSVVHLTEDEAKSPLWQASIRPVPDSLTEKGKSDDADLQAQRDAFAKEKDEQIKAVRKQIEQEHADAMDDANKKAAKIVADAEAQAEKIVADATAKAGTLTPATPAATSGKVVKPADAAK